jgi:hypothetical protein
MPGYFQDRRATAVLDPLRARVLFLGGREASLALVAWDLLAAGDGLVSRVRRAVAREAAARRQRPPEHVWVHATHTHTGGMVPRDGSFTSDAEQIAAGFYPGDVDEEWVEQLVARTAGAVCDAVAEAGSEAAASFHEGREATVAHYRRYSMRDGTVRTNPGRRNPDILGPAGEIDPRLHLLRFGSRRVLVVIYGLHPDCTGGTAYSADYPGQLIEALRERLGTQWRVLFLNAACGNINHVNVSAADQVSGPEEARRIGRMLFDAALQALDGGEPLTSDCLRVASASIACRLRRPSEAEVREAEERLRSGREPFSFNGLFAPAALVLARTQDREHQAEIAAVRLGSFGLAAMPGEVFVELAREVEDALPFGPCRTLGLTNGAMGYLPSREAFLQGGYEAGYRSARYEPDTGHRWAETAATLLRDQAWDSP